MVDERRILMFDLGMARKLAESAWRDKRWDDYNRYKKYLQSVGREIRRALHEHAKSP